MSWFYASNNQQNGPVTEAELVQLRRNGIVTADTLVWKVGFAGWVPYGEVAVAAGSPPPITAVAAGTSGSVFCGECGRSFAPDDVVKIGGRNICGGCKGIVVQRMKEGAPSDSDFERIRREHISHEASLKSVGLLYLISGTFGALAGFGLAAAGAVAGGAAGSEPPFVVFGILLGSYSVFTFATGLGLRRLKPWSRIASGIVSGVGLLAIGLGTIINLYVLYLLFSQKGSTVFSESYKQVMAETPHVKYRTSVVAWVGLGLIVLLIIGMAVMAFVG